VGLLRAHRLGFHFRDQETLERLAATRAVLFDKTGTLTFTRRRLERWDWVASFAADAAMRERVLAGTARLTGMSSHPVAMALHAALTEKRGTADVGNITAFAERPHFGLTGVWSPLDADAADAGKGGVGPMALCVCRYDAWGRNPDEFRAQGLTEPTAAELPAEGEPAPQSCLFVNGRLAAFIMLGEETKPGARDLLNGLKARGIPTCLLSGDHPDRVASFARKAGFEEWRGGVSPEQKQAEAQAFQEKHGAALAVGDGYNDSLLFGEASVSLAVQGAAGPVAAEADAFMTASDPAAILALLRIAAGTRRSLRNCYIVSGIYNTGAISLAVAGFVSPLTAAILMPIASLSLVLTAWVTIPKK
jgi:Cu2+-exporting ATPase